MRKVLFVDDMPEVLRMLKRTLDPIKGEWDMRFVESAHWPHWNRMPSMCWRPT